MSISERKTLGDNPFEVFHKLFLFVQQTPGAEKISFNSLELGAHYTIRFWSKKKTVDLHKTNEVTGHHETLFEISTFRLLLLLGRLQRIQQFLTKEIWLSHTINPGKLKKYDCFLFDLNNPDITQEDILKISGGKRLRLNKNLNFDKLTEKMELLPPDILHSRKEGMFMVYRFKRGRLLMQGMIFKIPQLKRNYFITIKDFNLTSKLTMIAIYNLASQINFDKKEEVLAVLRQLLSKKYKYLFGVNS